MFSLGQLKTGQLNTIFAHGQFNTMLAYMVSGISCLHIDS